MGYNTVQVWWYSSHTLAVIFNWGYKYFFPLVICFIGIFLWAVLVLCESHFTTSQPVRMRLYHKNRAPVWVWYGYTVSLWKYVWHFHLMYVLIWFIRKCSCKVCFGFYLRSVILNIVLKHVEGAECWNHIVMSLYGSIECKLMLVCHIWSERFFFVIYMFKY